jgi:hypothetical protein
MAEPSQKFRVRRIVKPLMSRAAKRLRSDFSPALARTNLAAQTWQHKLGSTNLAAQTWHDKLGTTNSARNHATKMQSAP